ncbi:unnamed protein product [Taenia asiatica]|uniref:Uncharacterized protein n=1 Tax=Taenia asiatica TaxID=60517 RepID=A0A0R3W032_TAEAS|nr:unnamed protein product [Taenia asiatica]
MSTLSDGLRVIKAMIATDKCGTVLTYSQSENAQSRFSPLPMLGALNLDDASTQLTFVLPAQEALTKSGMKAMAFGHSYNLYSHSHLCYGVATIRARYLARLTEGSDLRKPVASPCHQSGLSMEVASDDVFQAPCVTSAGEDVMGPSIAKPSVRKPTNRSY